MHRAMGPSMSWRRGGHRIGIGQSRLERRPKKGPEPLSALSSPPDHYVEYQVKPTADAALHFRGARF